MDVIPVADLKIGMFVAELDRPWIETRFLMQGLLLSSPDEVDELQLRCRFVTIDRTRSTGEHYATEVREKDPKLQPLFSARNEDENRQRRRRFLHFLQHMDDDELQELSAELQRVEPVFEEVQHALVDVYRNMSQEQELNLHRIREGIRDLSGSIQRNPDALLWLTKLKRMDQYSFDHALDVAVYVMLLGSHIGWRDQPLLDLGLAGLLQDVGKAQLPSDLLNKSGELDASEKELIRSHVASSLELLIGQEGVSRDVLGIISRHHERWDGSGYPRGLFGRQIGLGGEMAGLADSFCAMTANRNYRQGVSHQNAIEQLYALRDKLFSPTLMEQFVQCAGLYPIGTLVELNNGEVGIVIQHNRVQRSRPVVLILLDKDKEKARDHRIIDLRQDKSNGQGTPYRVRTALPANSYGLMASDYYLD